MAKRKRLIVVAQRQLELAPTCANDAQIVETVTFACRISQSAKQCQRSTVSSVSGRQFGTTLIEKADEIMYVCLRPLVLCLFEVNQTMKEHHLRSLVSLGWDRSVPDD